jgi:hypothetical protein
MAENGCHFTAATTVNSLNVPASTTTRKAGGSDFPALMAGKDKSTSVLYSGCQKNVPLFERFLLQPLMPILAAIFYKKIYIIKYFIMSSG